MAVYCKYCHQEINPAKNFCGHCGKPIDHSETTKSNEIPKAPVNTKQAGNQASVPNQGNTGNEAPKEPRRDICFLGVITEDGKGLFHDKSGLQFYIRLNEKDRVRLVKGQWYNISYKMPIETVTPPIPNQSAAPQEQKREICFLGVITEDGKGLFHDKDGLQFYIKLNEQGRGNLVKGKWYTIPYKMPIEIVRQPVPEPKIEPRSYVNPTPNLVSRPQPEVRKEPEKVPGNNAQTQRPMEPKCTSQKKPESKPAANPKPANQSGYEYYYAEFTDSKTDEGKSIFLSPDGKRLSLYVNKEKYYELRKNRWTWIISKAQKGEKPSCWFPDTNNKAIIYLEAKNFEKDYCKGQMIYRPVIKTTPEYAEVALTPNFFTRIYRRDDDNREHFNEIAAGKVYSFLIKEMRKKDDRLVTDLEIGHAVPNALENYLMFDTFGDDPGKINVLTDFKFQDEETKEILYKKILGTGDPSKMYSAFRNYVLGRYKEEKKNHTLQIDHKRQTLEIDLHIKDSKGVPLSASIIRSNDRFFMTRIGSISASRFVDRYIYVENWQAEMRKLSDMALPERWDDNDGEHTDRMQKKYILIQYFRFTFYKAYLDHKIYEENGYAVMNTGLVDNSYDEIFCILKKNTSINDPDQREWAIDYFACVGKGEKGKLMNQIFTKVPEPPKYIDMENAKDLFYDTTIPLDSDYEHILEENMGRLPISFLQSSLSYDPKVGELIERGDRKKLQEYIIANPQHIRTLEMLFKSAIETTKKFCRWNYKTAIPIYYARTNRITLLLPLKVSQATAGNADIALVVEKLKNNKYQGQTILTLGMAYIDARQICRPNSDWLTIENVGNSEDSSMDEEEED